MSPPWGGPDYAKVDVYDMKGMLKPCDGLVPCFSFEESSFFPFRIQMLTYFFSLMDYIIGELSRYSLFKLGTMIASRVVMFLPRNVDLNQLADISLSVDPPWAVEASPFSFCFCAKLTFPKHVTMVCLFLFLHRSRRISSMES